jgi:nucleoside-diphosphate-sugar epimerase
VSDVFVTGGSGFVGEHLIHRLAGEGHRVRALARSERSARAVRGAGADPVMGDLSDEGSLREGADGCSLAFHAAAEVADWGPWEGFVRANVEGTERMLAACQAVGVRRFVHVGTEAGLLAGGPLVNVDETAPLRPDSKAPYAATKAMAEQKVRDANGDSFETIVVRPRLVWGPGDRTILPGLIEAIRAGRFAWIGGGRHLTSTTHVGNVVEGLVLGASRGRPGGVYFVTDGDPVVFRDFITQYVETSGVEPPSRSIPTPLARALTAGSEALWRLFRVERPPPLTRMTLWVSSLETTIDISHAREELGYSPVVSIADGMEELARTNVQRSFGPGSEAG